METAATCPQKPKILRPVTGDTWLAISKEDGGIGFIKKDPIVEETKPEVAFVGGVYQCIARATQSQLQVLAKFVSPST